MTNSTDPIASAQRRSVLSRLLAVTLTVVLAPFVYVAARFLGPRRSLPATTLLAPGDLPTAGELRHVKLGTSDAVVMRTSDGSLLALSLTCTHTGCTVNWRGDRRVFHCPCHNGLFAADGHVLAGPPRRPLERLTVEELPNGGVRLTDLPA